MYISEIWRYPVKSMRGQRLRQSEVLDSGLVGDRGVVVVSRETGRVITARTHPALLGMRGEVQEDGIVTVNGFAWDSPEAGELVSEAVRAHVELVDLGDSSDRFDVLPLLVATDGAIDELEIDSRRLRPNIIVGGVSGRTEREWPGHSLRLGETVMVEAAQLRMRCVMTTYDPDTLQQDRSVLFRIVKEMKGSTALDCSISIPGMIRENDPVKCVE